MLEIHANALSSFNSTYHEFLLRYKEMDRMVYGFVEGKDDPMFYRGLIENSLPLGWNVQLIQAGCKDNVISAYENIDWSRFSDRRITFFADRDLSDFFDEKTPCAINFYVTDNYSIENEAINSGTLRRLLEEILNVTPISPEEAQLINELFERNLECFREAITPIMAQIILWRRAGIRPCLNDIKIKDVFCFSDGYLVVRQQYRDPSARVQMAADCLHLAVSASDDLNVVINEFCQKLGGERFIRGKYLLWFLVEVAINIHQSICSIITRFSKPPKAKISFSATNAMTVVAPRLRCPESLSTFFEATYKEYIDKVQGRVSVA